MTGHADFIGSRGENAFALEITRETTIRGGRSQLFEAFRLGDKAEGCDFLVVAKTSNPRVQPSFFVQVKSTSTAGTLEKVNVRCSQAGIRRLQATYLPTYLVAVDVSDQKRERIYLMAVTAGRVKGVSRVLRKFPLSRATVKMALWKEVVTHYLQNVNSFAQSGFA